VEARLGLARTMLLASDTLTKEGDAAEAAGRAGEAQAAYQRALAFNGENQVALAGIQRLATAEQVRRRIDQARERMAKTEWGAAQAEINAALRVDPSNAQAKALKKDIAARLSAELPEPPEDLEKQAMALFSSKPVTLRFRDTDIKEVLDVFARTAGVNVFTDESLQPKRVTAFFQNLSLRDSFNMILMSNRLFAKKVADNTVIVVPDNPGKRQQYDELQVQTFYLTDADAKIAVNLLRSILNTRQVFVNEKLNALVVRETPEKVALARKVLEANDRSVGEVEIDLQVLEVDRDAVENLGIDFSPRTLAVSFTFPTTIPVGDIFNTIRQGTTVGITNPSLILNLVKNDSSTRTLANPSIRILDRQKARLLIGERRPFQVSSISSVPAVAGSTTTVPTGSVTTTQTNIEYRDLGLKLTLTPTVHLDGEVTVELNFEISSAGAPISGITDAQLLPPVNTRNLDSFIKVRNGETRLLGGLFQEVLTENNTRFPFLGEIPGLGRLFQSPSRERTRTDVLIALTPRIVKALERPDPGIESFPSGTADSYGPGAPFNPAPAAAPVAPPRSPLPATVPGAAPAPAPGATSPSPRP
jgi:general secretion pathway protein D